jgi:hypothetical protein
MKRKSKLLLDNESGGFGLPFKEARDGFDSRALGGCAETGIEN